MKLKAGLTRRDFLRIVSAGTCGCAAHSMLAPIGGMMAVADPGEPGNGNVVVIVYLGGGASTSLFPLRKGFNPSWLTRMGGVAGLAYEDNTLFGTPSPYLLNEQQMLNPGLSALGPIFQAGNGVILNRVGMPDGTTPDIKGKVYPKVEYTQSHDGDTDIYQTANFRNGSGTGIVAAAVSGSSNPLAAAALGGNSLLVQGGRNQPIALSDLDNLGESNIGWSTQQYIDLKHSLGENGVSLGEGHGIVIRNALDNVRFTIDSVRSAISGGLPNEADYQNGDGFMNACRDAARVIIAGALKARFVTLSRGNWDTHSDARNTVANNAVSLSRGLYALSRSLQLTGNWSRTTIITMSEFGRTFFNGSGDDHGNCQAVMMLGGAINRPGNAAVYNAPASDAEVASAGNFLKRYEIDFRAPYYDAFKWAGFDADALFDNPPPNYQFSRLGILAP